MERERVLWCVGDEKERKKDDQRGMRSGPRDRERSDGWIVWELCIERCMCKDKKRWLIDADKTEELQRYLEIKMLLGIYRVTRVLNVISFFLILNFQLRCIDTSSTPPRRWRVERSGGSSYYWSYLYLIYLELEKERGKRQLKRNS